MHVWMDALTSWKVYEFVGFFRSNFIVGQCLRSVSCQHHIHFVYHYSWQNSLFKSEMSGCPFMASVSSSSYIGRCFEAFISSFSFCLLIQNIQMAQKAMTAMVSGMAIARYIQNFDGG